MKLKVALLLLGFFAFGIFLRHINIGGSNIAFDYDQYEDMYYTRKLAVDHEPVIIGRAIYGDPRLHHGVFYYYYNFIPFLASGGNPYASLYWNIFFNTSTALTVFFLSKSLFGKILPALISAFLVVSSFEIIKFSSWLTIDTVAIFIIPLFYLGLWFYFEQGSKELVHHQKRSWGLPLALVCLGFAIHTDLLFLYLIPILLIYWLIFRPPLPSFKLFFLSLALFLISISTLIYTELKLEFAGVKTLLSFSQSFGDLAKLSITERFFNLSNDMFENFAYNLSPQRLDLGIYLGVFLILSLVSKLFKPKTLHRETYAIYFLLFYLFSPFITVLIGYHDKPWFLIAVPPAIALISGYAISKFRNIFLVLIILALLGVNSFNFVKSMSSQTYKLLDPVYDESSNLKNQLEVLDYTYQHSGGKAFAINAVTYPLYYNGMWAYLYEWYGKEKYGFVPGWLGGDQLHPYDLLPKSKSTENQAFMIISETSRIPEVFKNQGKSWANNFGEVVEEKTFPGFTVIKINPKNK